MEAVRDVLASAIQLVEALDALLKMTDTMRKEIGDLEEIRRRIQLIQRGFYGLEADGEVAEEETTEPVSEVNHGVEDVELDLDVGFPSTTAVAENEQHDEGQQVEEEEPIVLLFEGDDDQLSEEGI